MSQTILINGIEVEVEGNATVKVVDGKVNVVTEQPPLVVEGQINTLLLEEEPTQVELLLPAFTDAVEEEEEEEIELIQCNFLAERWLIDYFSKEYKKAKQESTSKLLKREFVGQLIAGKFQGEYPAE